MTTYGDMVFEFGGAPVGSGRFSSPWAKHYFVDGIDGKVNNGGLKPDDAMSTIQGAIDLAVGGDVIYIRPKSYTLGTGFARYEESVTITQGGTAGSGQTATNANISLIGVTQRRAGPPSDGTGVRWKYATAASGCLIVQAPATHVENIGFFAEDATTFAIHLDGDSGTRAVGWDFSSFYNCAIKGKQLYAEGMGDGLQIVGCMFQTKHDGTGTPSINLVGSAGAVTRPIIHNCHFLGGNLNNCYTTPLATLGPVYDISIRECYFTYDPDTGDYITFTGGATANSGFVSNCYFASEDANAKLQSIVSGANGVWGAGLCDENGMVDLSS